MQKTLASQILHQLTQFQQATANSEHSKVQLVYATMRVQSKFPHGISTVVQDFFLRQNTPQVVAYNRA
jgi:hypothetical protein